jgi:transcriptional regulator GlxA family with amidase domain
VHYIRAHVNKRSRGSGNKVIAELRDARVLLIVKLLNDSCRTALGIDQLSTECNLSPSRVQHLFKQHTGTTLLHYFKEVRLLKARQLLETSFLTIKEISFNVGFSDLSHFVRDYKKRFGQTPTHTRQNVQLTSTSTKGQQIADLANTQRLVINR